MGVFLSLYSKETQRRGDQDNEKVKCGAHLKGLLGTCLSLDIQTVQYNCPALYFLSQKKEKKIY